MNISETAKIIRHIDAVYPAKGDKDATLAKIKIWHEYLKDLDLRTVAAAVKTCIEQSEFAPTIAAIRKAAAMLDNTCTWPDEAWAHVITAVKRFGYAQPEKAFASMPVKVAHAVKRFGWREICMSENIDVIRGQFLKLYAAMIERDQKAEVLSPDIREHISSAIPERALTTPQYMSYVKPVDLKNQVTSELDSLFETM